MTTGSAVMRCSRKATGMLLTPAGVFLIVVGFLFEKAWFHTATKVEGAWIVGVIGAVFFSGGVGCYRLGRKLKAESAEEILARDPRPPVLYLRSFHTDAKAATTVKEPRIPFTPQLGIGGLGTEEEQLAMVLDRIGPCVAIGQPGELLPTKLGAPVLLSQRRPVAGDGPRADPGLRAGDPAGWPDRGLLVGGDDLRARGRPGTARVPATKEAEALRAIQTSSLGALALQRSRLPSVQHLE